MSARTARRIELVVQGDRVHVDGRELCPGEVVRVAGIELALRREPTDAEPPWRIEAALHGRGAPWARLIDVRTEETHTVTAPNRVALLYFLARAHEQDVLGLREAPGWRTNDEASVAVWGRARRGHDPRLLKALIHTVRVELKRAGLDPRCLEKRRGWIRLCVRSVRLCG